MIESYIVYLLKMASFKVHCIIGFFIRVLMIVYGIVQDEIFKVKYTDIDYKVFTDAANHVVKGNSPFNRYTYRYSPLLAYLMIPNVVIHPICGKVLFSLCDIIICVSIKKLLKIEKVKENMIHWCVFFWLYNPMTIIISTRGNADSLSSLLVLSVLLTLRKKYYVLTGILHGISIHFRIYPIAFSLCMYLSITNNNKQVKNKSDFNKLVNVLPTLNQIKLVLSCILTLFFITTFFYLFYGYTFLHESLLYHLNRHDIRHNFSVYFYLQYLSSVSDVSIVQRILIVFPQIVLLVVTSCVYGRMNQIYFCHLLIAFILVTYNTVLTCQYFIWFLCVMPLVIPRLKVSIKETILLITLWGVSQLAWLLPAYLLEFKNENSFVHIWFQGLVFFCTNIFVITRLIVNFDKRVKSD